MSGVLILRHGIDPSALSVEDELRRRSVPVTAVDLSELPERGDLSLEDDTALVDGRPLGSFPVVLNRSGLTTLGCPSPRGLAERNFKTWYGRYLAEKERLAMLVSFLALLEAGGARLVNPPGASDVAMMRPLLLDRLRRAGAPIWTSEARAAADAFPSHAPGPDVVLARLYRFGRRTLAAGRLERHPGKRPCYVPLESVPEDAEKLASTVLEQTNAEFAAVDVVLGERSAAFWSWDPAPGFSLFERDTDLEVAGSLAERLEEMLR